MPTFNPQWLADNRFEVARYAFDGETVFVPFLKGGVWYLAPAKVVCAAGNHVRTASEKHGFDRWFDVYDIYRRT